MATFLRSIRAPELWQHDAHADAQWVSVNATVYDITSLDATDLRDDLAGKSFDTTPDGLDLDALPAVATCEPATPEELLWPVLLSDDAARVASFFEAHPEVSPDTHTVVTVAGKRMKGLIAALVMPCVESARALLLQGASANICDEDGDSALLYAASLGFEDAVELLLGHGADVMAVGRDYKTVITRGIVEYSAGGQNALHRAALRAARPGALLKQLTRGAGAAADAAVAAIDFNGDTPSDLFFQQAAYRSNIRRGRLLAADLPAFDASWAAETEAEWVAATGVPSVRGLRSKDVDSFNGWMAAKVQGQRLVAARLKLAAVISSGPSFPVYTPASRAVVDDPRSLLHTGEGSTPCEIHPGVWMVRFLSPQGCTAVSSELLRVERFMVDNGSPPLRPNSMNNYGMVLTGTPLQPLADFLFGELKRLGGGVAQFSAKAPLLESHHSFSIRYGPGQDKDLASHVDKSSLTFNLCLGDDGFTGAEVYFHEQLKGAGSASFASPLPGPDGCSFEYAHSPGVAIIHAGNVVHGTKPITSGHRHNVLVWGREAL